MRTFATAPLPADLERRLRACGSLTSWGAQPPTEAELIEALPGHDALVCLLTAPVTRAVLDAAPKLELVAQVAVGLDNIDRVAAAERGLPVTHTPGVLTDATADLTLALLLATCRRVVEADRYLRGGRWHVWSLDLLTGLQLRGATLGIIGWGRIGRAVAERAQAFGMRVIHHSRRSGLPLPELLAQADVVSLHCPLTPDTAGLMNRERLFAMKPGSVLINTARGALVDEDALALALERGPIARAGLDVHAREPRVHPALLGREDVVLLPHIGSATEATRHRMAEMAVEAVEALAAGAPLPHQAPDP